MRDNIEADYLVDKLAGRLEEYFRIPNGGYQYQKVWQAVVPDAKEDAKQIKKEYKDWEWRIESLEEYRQRKEQE